MTRLAPRHLLVVLVAVGGMVWMHGIATGHTMVMSSAAHVSHAAEVLQQANSDHALSSAGTLSGDPTRSQPSASELSAVGAGDLCLGIIGGGLLLLWNLHRGRRVNRRDLVSPPQVRLVRGRLARLTGANLSPSLTRLCVSRT